MGRVTQHNWLLKVGAVLFLLAQVVVSAHAAEHGSEHHEHDCEVCLAALNDEQDGLVSAAEPSLPIFNARTLRLTECRRPAIAAQRHSIRPPATGPPAG